MPIGDGTGGKSSAHEPLEALPILLAPATGKEKNTIRMELIPVACWKLNDVRFEFGSSFVLPDSKPEFTELAGLRRDHPGSPLSVFGHADPVSTDASNKRLSDHRAEAVYGILRHDTKRWEKLYNAGGASEGWGAGAIQQMLRALGEDPGPVTGKMNPQTRLAVQSFQGKNSLKTDGDPGPKTREKLFLAYMQFLWPAVLEATDFLAQGQDKDGKGDVQGCGEFNPAMVFSQSEDKEFSKPENKEKRDEENSENRRVMVLLFRKGSVVPPAKWPCPRVGEGVEGCRKRFWSDGEKRRAPQEARREFKDKKDTFACRFYQRLVEASPCEGIEPIDPLALLTLDKVDHHFCPKQETLSIVYTIRNLASKAVMLRVSSPHAKTNPIFERPLTAAEKTSGQHTIEWDGKLTDETFVHPLLSPFDVTVTHNSALTGSLPSHVLYHSIELKQGPWTPDEKEPEDEKKLATLKLNELGYFGGPVEKDTDSYFKKAIIRYKANHVKFRKTFIKEYDDTVTPEVLAALKAKEADRKLPPFDAITDPSKTTRIPVEALTYERTGKTTDEFGNTRPQFDKARLNRPVIPVEATIYLKKKDDSKVLEPEAVGPARITWRHTDADEDLSGQFDDAPDRPSRTRRFIEKTLKLHNGRTAGVGDNCPTQFGGIRSDGDAFKHPFLLGDSYVPYEVKPDDGVKGVFSLAAVDREKFPKRLGKAGVMLRPSFIAGDDYQYTAELDFAGRPNQKQLEELHGIKDEKTKITAKTGTFLIRRFNRVAVSAEWPGRKSPLAATAKVHLDYEWEKIAEEFEKAHNDVDVKGLASQTMSSIITQDEYKDLVAKHTSHKDKSKITLTDDCMVGVALPAQGNRNADTYKTLINKFTGDNFNSLIQTPLGQLLSKKLRPVHPTGFIVTNFLAHKPVDIKTDPKKGKNDVTEKNKDYVNWAGSIGLSDSVILADMKDPDLVYYVVSHEMGHNFYLLHWENTGENNLNNHDQADHNCSMSYSTNKGPAHQKQGKYAPHFCGKCNLALRGWDITSAGMGKKSKDQAAKGGKGSLVVEVTTPTGEAVAGAEVELVGGAKKKTDTKGKADFGEVDAGPHEIKVRKKGYGPPMGEDAFQAGDGRLESFDVVEGEDNTAKLQLLTVKSIAISHTPESAANPRRIYKAHTWSTEVLHELTATVSAPVKSGTGRGTQARVDVEWTFTADPGNCPKDKGGKDDTMDHFMDVPGYPTVGDLKTRAVTTTGDDGVTKIRFSASVVAGDKFTVHAKVLDIAPLDIKANSPQFEVWKLLDYKGLLQMETGANTGVDVGAVATVARMQPAFTPCFTEYRQGAVGKIAYKEFLSELIPPTAAQLPEAKTVTLQSDGDDGRTVTVKGLVVAADGTTSNGTENIVLNGTTPVAGAVRFQKITGAKTTASATRKVSIHETGGAARLIGAVPRNQTSLNLNFVFETDADVKAKAQEWYQANFDNLGNDVAAFPIPEAGFQFIGAAYYHPKLDGRNRKTSFYAGYPGVRIDVYGGEQEHPDDNWYEPTGVNQGQRSFIFLNATGESYKTTVARHEIGHGADTENFGGPGDPDPYHCPTENCLMYYAAQGDQFCRTEPQHSQRRMRGWKR